jgi:RNA polymerase sigma-70 factor, ECF subfamily
MDAAAFDALFQASSKGLQAYLARACGDPALAEDLMQEAYLRVLSKPPRDADPRAQRAYLYTTASRVLLAHWRRSRRFTWPWRAGPEDEEPMAAVPSTSPGPERVMGGREAVGLGWAKLSPRQRSLLWLAYVEGFDHSELAAALGLRTASVKVLLHRARRRMAAELQAMGMEVTR